MRRQPGFLRHVRTTIRHFLVFSTRNSRILLRKSFDGSVLRKHGRRAENARCVIASEACVIASEAKQSRIAGEGGIASLRSQ
jgi:hypothetical protein